MNLLKNLLTRLSDSLLSTVPAGFRNRALRRGPMLRLVSHNPAKAPAPDTAVRRQAGSATGQAEAVDEALARSEAWWSARQSAEGYWAAELEADSTLTSEYIMLRRFLDCVDHEREQKASRYLLATQLPDGGWPIYTGGPSEISASVKAYFALKLCGLSPDEPCMEKARTAILAKGGIVRANVFTKIALALFDQYDWRGLPTMPPELILLPKRFYFSLYAMSYWSRAVIIPLLIIFAHRPVCRIPRQQGIEELFVIPRDQVQYDQEPPFDRGARWFSWRNFFIRLDGVLKVYDRHPVRSIRQNALRKAEQWMKEHMNGDGGLGAIYPAMANSVLALRCLGHGNDDPLVRKALGEIEDLEIHGSIEPDSRLAGTMHVQPCPSPVWDTALTINAMIEVGLPPDHPSLISAASWLLSRQCRRDGDWSVSAPQARPGGWYFQFENEWYPDVDDSAAVLIGLSKVRLPSRGSQDESMARGFQWVLALQSSDGGWGAYDRNNNRMVFNVIPFADHRALLDPSTSDLAGRCLEMLGSLGYDRSHPAATTAIAFLRREQETDGSWYGRWGVNYIYGTWSVLAGLRAIGEDLSAPYIKKAVLWLESRQNSDGGWGESCYSYDDPSLRGQGDSTPSQTAWALLALLAAGVSDSISVVRGVHYLLRHQREDGTWDEPEFTGTGFPRVFYLRYHGYRHYFPMWALATYRNIRSRGQTKADELRDLAYQSGTFRFEARS